MKTETKSINVPALANEIVVFFPAWSVQTLRGWNEKEGQIDEQRAHLVAEDGMTISLFHDTYKKRLVISPIYPRGEASAIYPYEGRVDSITVASDRAAKAIAGEIERRLLPEFIPSYAKGLEQLAQNNKYTDGQRALWRDLCKLSGDAYSVEHKREFNAYSNSALTQADAHYAARVNGPDSVTFDQFSVNAKQAKAIIKLLSK